MVQVRSTLKSNQHIQSTLTPALQARQVHAAQADGQAAAACAREPGRAACGAGGGRGRAVSGCWTRGWRGLLPASAVSQAYRAAGGCCCRFRLLGCGSQSYWAAGGAGVGGGEQWVAVRRCSRCKGLFCRVSCLARAYWAAHGADGLLPLEFVCRVLACAARTPDPAPYLTLHLGCPMHRSAVRWRQTNCWEP